MSDTPWLDQGYVSPSPENPLSPGASTTPVALSGTASSTQPAAGTGDPPPDFVRFVNTALQSRLGLTKYGLIPASAKQELIRRIWQDPAVQQNYITNHQQIASGNISSVAVLENQIQQVMLGQGDDPTVAIDYTNMLQVAGVPLTTGEQAALAGATQSINAAVPKPFGTNTVSGYDFGAPMPKGGWTGTGQSFGWQTHMGVDYGTPQGTRIVSPFAGTVHVETNVPGYGNYVTITLDNGWKIGFGHVGQGFADGQRVNPGDLIAISGRNVGSAKGAVTIVTWQDPNGQYVNPHQVMDPIFQGATFSSLGAPGAAGTGMPTVNKILDAEYPTVKNDWISYFGTPPSPEDVYDVISHGGNPTQWSDYIRSLPSHIDGLNAGQYHDVRTLADQVSTQVLGHGTTDGIVKELHAQQLTSQQAITNWYNIHGTTGIPPADYNKLYHANTAVTANIFNEKGADPRIIKQQYDNTKPGLIE